MLLPNITSKNIEIYKSLSTGLKSIYCDREDKFLRVVNIEEESVVLRGTIKLKNYNTEKSKFYIKVYLPEFMNEYITDKEIFAINEGDHTIRQFTLEGGEEKIIEAIFVGNISNNGHDYNFMGAGSPYFEFKLQNVSEELKFTERSK